MVWKTYGDCPNYLQLSGHKGAVLDLQWSRDSAIIFSASTDALLASWDVDSGVRIRRYVGHDDVVNALDVTRRGPELIVSASDDGTIGVCFSKRLILGFVLTGGGRYGILDRRSQWITLTRNSRLQQSLSVKLATSYLVVELTMILR